MNKEEARLWKKWECWIMNIIDIRLWFCDCECHYEAPFGLVVEANCPKHDKPLSDY